MTIGEVMKRKDKETYYKLLEMAGGNNMGLHHKSNKEVRKRKYQEQFARTEANKKRKAEKRNRK